jgi:hypothetical protein
MLQLACGEEAVAPIIPLRFDERPWAPTEGLEMDAPSHRRYSSKIFEAFQALLVGGSYLISFSEWMRWARNQIHKSQIRERQDRGKNPP